MEYQHHYIGAINAKIFVFMVLRVEMIQRETVHMSERSAGHRIYYMGDNKQHGDKVGCDIRVFPGGEWASTRPQTIKAASLCLPDRNLHFPGISDHSAMLESFWCW